jgi:hypothetical protein
MTWPWHSLAWDRWLGKNQIRLLKCVSILQETDRSVSRLASSSGLTQGLDSGPLPRMKGSVGHGQSVQIGA